ncbi:hypothetical protein NIES593_09025 [Hydrococcus rivularis NIES-593]|uniref:Hydrolase n=1 Tax=Hydrococcus rivularis NIES-593 TaxID=1921803 RepID=A0A1U7HJM3_9CYAN|nr:hypothetical protein [Hydrococcus rivularis]OKH23790.1 hypothetical protein NIES593_09025 [Hydrococcus rivularis NIES-593]
MKTVVHSFDVFDTVLVRIWAKPTDLFWELGNQLQRKNLITISVEAWMNLRVEAERQARKKSVTEEVTIEEIYKPLAEYLDWSPDTVARVIQQEINLELLSLRPVPEIKKRIQELHQCRERIIYISDMYLPKEAIELFLQKNQLWEDGDRLYLSSEMGLTKASRKLFELCLDKECLKPYQLTHIGDNLYSDVKVPKKLGIQTKYFAQTHLNRYEKLVAETIDVPLKFRSLLAGTSRLTRLQCQENSLHKKVIWDTAASAIAPILFGFVYWCLEQAQRLGRKRLYFVARDGQVLLKIAKIICHNWNYEIDCRYLYGSRQAWHFPAIQEITEKELDWIFDPTLFLSVNLVCERVNLNPEEIKDCLVKNGFLEEVWNTNLNKRQREALKSIFQKVEICDRIVARAKEYRLNAIGYFCEEGLGDGVPFGIVDIGWNGRLQRSLSNLLATVDMYPEDGVCGFYFGLSQRLKAYPTDRLLAYFSDPDRPLERDYLCSHRGLIEVLVSADHGSTVKFEKSSDSYRPILRSKQNELAIEWGIETYQRVLEEWVDNFTLKVNKSLCKANYFLRISELLMTTFFEHPTPEEAQTFGSFLLSEDQTETIYHRIAPYYHIHEAIKLLILRKNKSNFAWLPASALISGSIASFFLKLYLIQSKFKRYIKAIKFQSK